MKRLFLLTAVVFQTFLAMAQSAVSGKVVEDGTGDPMAQTTVKLLKSDSTLATGVLTGEDGRFSLKAPRAGRYILQITSVGYKTYTKDLRLTDDKDVSVGTVSMKTDAVMLQGTTVSGHAAKVTLKADTFVYNATAFRTPEGSVVEELVKRLPGAQVDDDGKITINGKEVKKILVDGKEFMTGDTKTAMKNLPTSIVERVKAYDEKSDLARVSGIDDGEEQTVLDFGIKRGMNRGMFSNVDVAGGTRDRYAARLMGAMFQDGLRVMSFVNANNTNDMGFPGGGGGGRFGGGRQGLNASKMVGLNMNYEQRDRLKLDGSIRWNHSDGDVNTRTSAQELLGGLNQWSNSLSQNYSRSNSWNAQMRLEWMPDSMTNIMFRPTASYQSNDGRSSSLSATFKDDPYRYVDDPLTAANIAALRSVSDTTVMNRQQNTNLSYSDQKSIGGSLQYNRKLSTTGRNITLRAQGTYSENDGRQMQANSAWLYQLLNAMGTDSTYQTTRYNLTPTKNYNYSLRVTYSEPIARATYLQFSYEFQYRYSKSDRSTYDLFSPADLGGITPVYRAWDSYLSLLQNPLDTYLSDSLSRFSQYKNYIHNFQVMLRIVRKAYNFNVGVELQPQRSHFIQRYLNHDADTTRTVTNFTPTADFRWKISNVSQLRFNYRGNSSQPSMSDLLDITDNSDPLNIRKGNPGLKPSFTQNFRLFYNNYFQQRQQAVMAHVNFSTTSNSISNMVTYDQQTGGRITRPENISGNWRVNGAFMFNTAIDTTGYFNVNTFTNLGYNHIVGYAALDRTSSSVKSVTKSTSLSERLATSYRNSWIEVELNGAVEYNHSRNALLPTADLDTWKYVYGGSINLTAPWGTRLATDMNMNSRRGFSDRSMNTNELIWNAQVSQSFLRGNALTLSLQFYDILHRQSTVSRMVDAMRRSDSETNAVTNYAMLHVIYRFNAFGGRDVRRDMRRGGEGRPDFGPGGGGFGGPPPSRGGFGGPRRF